MTLALTNQIQNIINTSITTFIKNVSDNYEIDKQELEKLWDSVNGSESPTCFVKPQAQKKTAIITKPSPSKSESTGTNEGCPYVYTKGEKEGQICNTKPKGGVVFCTRHKKYEGTEPKQKKILPSTKKSIAGNAPVTKKSPVKKEVNTVLRKNKAIDMLWHSSTGMVFKSAKERIVIGKCENDKILPLTKDDIEVCMAHSFAYEEIVSDSDSEEDKISSGPQKQTISNEPSLPQKSTNSITTKKSMTDAIAKTNMKAQDVELILSELQISPVTKKTNVDSDLFGDSDEDDEEDLLEEEDDE
jgi:hypothetical protein